MSLTPGTRLGVYEIIAQIGVGGMGEVYRATDSNLKRAVAIKVLPASMAGDADRLARFQREAEVLAALNHPNIAAIYGLEKTPDFTALVMELVEGEDLSQRIAKGAIPIDEALPIARQIAEALEAAHEQGIIHRDLKPANIKVRPDGTVKVLDFGLAKAMEPAAGSSPGMSMSPTLTTPAMTQAGMILGTAAYMSPEQARGKTVDRRADIWAFGAVLFEMLTGKHAFVGDDVSEVLASVLAREPDWARLPATLSPALGTYLKRCLHKTPKQRIADVQDIRLALEGAFEVAVPPAAPAVAPIASRTRERLAWTAALGVVSLAALGLAAFVSFGRAPADGRAVFPMPLPDGWNLTKASSRTAAQSGPLAVSPDGRRVAFLANQANGPNRLWVRALDTMAAQELPGTDGASSPFWSPDSRFVGFFADGKLKKIAATGGPAVVLCDTADHRGGTWSRDGVILFAPSNHEGLQKVSGAGGVPTMATTLAQGERGHARPVFLPDGRHFFFYEYTSSGIFIGSLDSSDRTLLIKNADAETVVYTAGHLLFLRGNALMAQPFDARKLALTGEPVPVAEQVLRLGNPSTGVFSASDAGVLAYQTGSANAIPDRQLTWFDRTGKVLGLVDKPGQYSTVALSPDGTRVAVSRDDLRAAGRGTGQAGNTDLWVHEFARATSTRLTFDPARDWMAVWSPDGSRLAWGSTRDGANDNLYQKVANGAGTDEALLKSSDKKTPYDWSPDGRFLVYAVATGTHDSRGVPLPPLKAELWVLPLTGDTHTPTRYLQQAGFNVGHPRFSPDGRYVAYTSNASGSNEVYVQPFPVPAGGKWLVSQGGGAQPRWRRDGKELFYISTDSKVMVVTVGTSPAFTPGVPKALFAVPIWGGGIWDGAYDVTADGQKFLINVLPTDTTAAATPTPTPITVVLNWATGLKP